MSDPTRSASDGQSSPAPAAYEPPRVDQVLTATDLELEILYAGEAALSPDLG